MPKGKRLVAGAMPAAVNRMVEGLRKPFMAFVEQFTAITAARAELAPKFMRIYGAYMQATGETFVAFVRVLDPNVPAERAAYRGHPTYAAADYLRRLVARSQTASGKRRTPATRSNLLALARTLATIVPLVKDPDIIWRAVETEFGFTARQVGRLRQVVSETKPLLAIHAKATTAEPIHIETPAKAGALVAA